MAIIIKENIPITQSTAHSRHEVHGQSPKVPRIQRGSGRLPHVRTRGRRVTLVRENSRARVDLFRCSCKAAQCPMAMQEDADAAREVEVRLYLYLIFGGLAILTNLPIIVVFFSSKEFRQRFVLFQFLAIADLVRLLSFKFVQINGVSIFVAGLSRIQVLHSGRFYDPITPEQCLSRYPWPVLFIIAGERPVACMLRSIPSLGLSVSGRGASRCHLRSHVVPPRVGYPAKDRPGNFLFPRLSCKPSAM